MSISRSSTSGSVGIGAEEHTGSFAITVVEQNLEQDQFTQDPCVRRKKGWTNLIAHLHPVSHEILGLMIPNA